MVGFMLFFQAAVWIIQSLAVRGVGGDAGKEKLNMNGHG